MIASRPLLSAKISAGYPGNANVLDGFELEINEGEIIGLVGESGSGKSTVAMAILRLLQFKGGSVAGQIRFQGRDLIGASEREMRAIRGRHISMVMQSPLASLNPAMRIGDQILESWRAHRSFSDASVRARLDVPEVLRMVNLSGDRGLVDRYPSELSVGQAQRVLIAIAILHRPALLIADEPTSALDALTQSEILNLFRRLNRELGMSILFVSHDLLSVASFCHRIGILRQGRIIESNRTEEIFRNPRLPYTQSLLAAIPRTPFTNFPLPALV